MNRNKLDPDGMSWEMTGADLRMIELIFSGKYVEVQTLNFQTTVAIKMIFDVIEYQFEHISKLNVLNTKLSADAFKKLL